VGLNEELENLYAQCCGHLHDLTATGGDEKTIEDLLRQLHANKLTGQNIHYPTYKATADKLMDGLQKGVRLSENPAANAMTAYMRNNIFAFSAAKNFAEQKTLSELLLKPDGSLKTFAEFKNDAKNVIENFDKKYLQTEYNHAVACGQMAEKWQTLNANKEAFQLLEYRTMRDARVREEHAELEGTILPIDSPVWDIIYPPNGWNCRCDVIPSAEENKMSDAAEVGKIGKQKIDDYFKTNVGKTGIVYQDNLPYYKTVKGNIQDLDPVKNYNLAIPEKKDMPALPAAQTKEEYNAWWNDMVKQNGIAGTNNFVLKDVLGTEINFTAPESGFDKSTFRDHVLVKRADSRFEYIHNVVNVIAEPDEVFTHKYKDIMETVYIKYFKDAPLVLIIENTMSDATAKTMYKLNNSQAGFHATKRRGILLYKKVRI
jgi:SPP1 gp7 family putative phage head morphogenesis protein